MLKMRGIHARTVHPLQALHGHAQGWLSDREQTDIMTSKPNQTYLVYPAHRAGSKKGKMYGDLTSTLKVRYTQTYSKRIERLFPRDPRLEKT